MSEALYDAWVKAGSHWTLHPAITELKKLIIAKYPHANVMTLGDHAHLIATPAQDHTPYSQTGWPHAAPHGQVDATDIENIPNLYEFGLKMLNAHRNGQARFLHYMNLAGQNWSADRDDWKDPNPSSDGHAWIHLSFRTDVTSLGGYDPFPAVTSHYTVETGDTLYSIAVAAKTTVAAIYGRNKTIIEAAARAHGHATSNNGSLIFVGTVLDMTGL